MKKKLIKGLLFIALGYLLLVAAHFLNLELGGRSQENVFHVGSRASGADFRQESNSSPFSKSGNNYATFAFQAVQSQVTVEQKYEKIGSIESLTEKFDEDEKRARDIIKQYNALIQGEAVTSSANLRHLSLTIGVPPASFDAVVGALKGLGKSSNFQVTKTDKTNDFLELKAKRTTLEKARDSLTGLKIQGGKIDELVTLEQEILKLEDQIQGLGVQLGQFDKVNEFCTVRLSLDETLITIVRSRHLDYLLQSIEWASTIYLAFLGIACLGLFAVIIVLILIEKSKIFRSEPDLRT